MLENGLEVILDFFKIFVSTIVDTLKTLFSMLPKIFNEMKKLRK